MKQNKTVDWNTNQSQLREAECGCYWMDHCNCCERIHRRSDKRILTFFKPRLETVVIGGHREVEEGVGG